jgi:hypothetical protein
MELNNLLNNIEEEDKHTTSFVIDGEKIGNFKTYNDYLYSKDIRFGFINGYGVIIVSNTVKSNEYYYVVLWMINNRSIMRVGSYDAIRGDFHNGMELNYPRVSNYLYVLTPREAVNYLLSKYKITTSILEPVQSVHIKNKSTIFPYYPDDLSWFYKVSFSKPALLHHQYCKEVYIHPYINTTNENELANDHNGISGLMNSRIFFINSSNELAALE